MEVGSWRDSIRQEVNFSYFRRFVGTSVPPLPPRFLFAMRDDNNKNKNNNNKKKKKKKNKRPCTLIYFPAARKMARDRCRGLIRSRNVFTWFHRIAVWLTRDIQFPCRRRMRRHEAPTVRLKTFDTRPSSAFSLRNNDDRINRRSRAFRSTLLQSPRRDPRGVWRDTGDTFFFFPFSFHSRNEEIFERISSKSGKRKKKNWLCLCNGEINIEKMLTIEYA